MYKVWVYHTGIVIAFKSFPTYREACEWAGEQERADRGVTEIKYEPCQKLQPIKTY